MWFFIGFFFFWNFLNCHSGNFHKLQWIIFIIKSKFKPNFCSFERFYASYLTKSTTFIRIQEIARLFAQIQDSLKNHFLKALHSPFHSPQPTAAFKHHSTNKNKNHRDQIHLFSGIILQLVTWYNFVEKPFIM